jgi:hypothetical protein
MEMEKPIEMTAQATTGDMVKPRLFVREVSLANVSLAIQFLLGMYINLYVNFPKTGPADAWKFAWHTWPVAAHIILGTLILLSSISTLVRSIILKNRHWIIYVSIGVAAMLLSVIGGETFITTQNELASFFMSFGFLIGLLALNWSLYTQ